MSQVNYNTLYRFISDGTWFKAGTECVVEDDTCLWRNWDANNPAPITSEEMAEHRSEISGLFRGLRVCENEGAEGCPVGTPRENDGEVCGLDEFEVIKREESTT